MKNKKIYLKLSILLLCISGTLFLTGYTNKKEKIDLSLYTGVWANADSELVQTEKYSLLFHRNGKEISITLRNNKVIKNTLYSILISGYIFDTETKEYEKIISEQKDRIPFTNYFNLSDGELNIIAADENIKLKLIEKINIVDRYEMPSANGSNTGECLQAWHLGVIEHSLNPENIHIEIGTNKHSYIFMGSSNALYCRAARIRHNNNGSLFAQNIRCMINPNTKERTAFMEENNAMISSKDLEINDSLFQPDVCTYHQDGIYWSLISYTPGTIKLNGCGEIYTYNRPKTDNKKISEWIKYIPY